jgi:NADPH:quinone reductase-like Zn-dependent oxidoreductase
MCLQHRDPFSAKGWQIDAGTGKNPSAELAVCSTDILESILVHSACGGVGLAAIQIARMCGARIYATVGTDQKVDHLVENFGLPRSSIFSSRDESFVEGLMQATKGEGVDLVLNSLSGELLHASWRCVAEFGTMVEIGKRDILGAGKLDMSPFLHNRSYSCVDLEGIRTQRPDWCKR